MKKGNRTAEYEFSIGYRASHWIRFFAIMILIVSGYYISFVFQSPEVSSEPVLFLQAKWRFAHIVAGFVMIATVIYKSYLFVFDGMSKIERVSIKDFLSPKVWIAQIKYYLYLSDEHPHLRGVYNPLQFVAYIMFYAIAFLLIITGLILYMHVYHEGFGGAIYDMLRPLEVSMGGLANVRAIHHVCMNVLLIFILAHVYMAVFNAIKGREGGMDAVISGYKFPKED
ncbi:MAG: Ni/Fe-hydrogenase, b-type cytochrome subunit [Campylobacteraceae bacterium]|nr:Ni/Fe-hydrogenase, b-type cytochrome subunit [Campylobacteraceae bacterium]